MKQLACDAFSLPVTGRRSQGKEGRQVTWLNLLVSKVTRSLGNRLVVFPRRRVFSYRFHLEECLWFAYGNISGIYRFMKHDSLENILSAIQFSWVYNEDIS